MKTISQSLIRDMLSPKGYCGYYLNEVYNNGFRTEPTPAMLQGLVFEQEILGSTRDGEHVEMPKSMAKGKEGSILKAEIELFRIIRYAKSILEANEILFTDHQIHMINENRHGHIDAVGTYHGQPYIFDLKFTGMAYSSWQKEYQFGNTSANFRLQGLHYQSISEPLPFMFLVFGDGWSRFMELPYEADDIEHHCEVATEALDTFNEMDYRPTTDSRLCFECPMSETCPVKNSQIQIEQL
jgi:hypothetical protein